MVPIFRLGLQTPANTIEETTMKFVVKIATTIAALMAINPLWAATYTFEAVTDFTDINAGDVPYYRHNGINALAINAADESYRDKFARATLDFAEVSGVYDVTITALGETDGDGEFRFLVDGVVVGSAVNSPASQDYGEQLHTFENISIPQGAVIGVESIAVSNGTIPEGDAFAYARGRWTRLTIADTDTSTPEEYIDLALDISADSATASIEDEISFDVAVENFSDDYAATTPTVVLTFGDGLANFASDLCTETGTDTLTCELPEIGANEKSDFTVTATASSSGDKVVEATVTADQFELDTYNNTGIAYVEVAAAPVEEVVTPANENVDLQIAVTADKDSIEIGDTVTYNVSVTNVHASNTATSPSVSIAMPASLQFAASDSCTVDDRLVTCEMEELPPGANRAATFAASAIAVNSYSQVFATASADQPEDNVANNEQQIITRISPEAFRNTQPTANNTDASATSPDTNSSDTNSGNTNSGGGALQLPVLLLLFIASLTQSRRRHS